MKRSLQEFLDAGLGKIADAEVAEKLGVSKQRAHQVRTSLGIPLNREASILLRQRRVAETIRIRYGIKLDKIARAFTEFGQVRKTAQALGVVEGTVRHYLCELGIPLPATRTMALEAWIMMTDWDRRNKAIAEELEVSRNTIANLRVKMKHRGYEPPAAPLGSPFGWRNH